MHAKTNDLIARDSIFAWIALATGLVLLVPLIAMQFSNEVNWGAADFMIIGFLLFAAGSLFVLVARRVPRKYRIAVAMTFVLATLYVWAELAVGIFTHLGS